MTTIISKDDFNIIHNYTKNPHIFKIHFNIYSEELINSITKTKIILGTTITNNYHTLIINATSVTTFADFQKEQHILNGTNKIPINIISKLILDLSSQLQYLILYTSKCFLGYHQENIIVIDNNKFIYLSNEYLKDIYTSTNESDSNNETLLVSFPFTHNDFFLSPELLAVTELPAKVHYKTSYYSLACLILSLITTDIDIRNIQNIKNTKIFWLLERMLIKEPKNRSIILL